LMKIQEFHCLLIMKPKKELPILTDAVAPKNYHPVFFKAVKPFHPNINKLVVDQYKTTVAEDKVSVYFHIMDSSGTYYSGASDKKFRNLFCKIVEIKNGKEAPLKKYILREITDHDNTSLALSIVMDHSGSMGDDRARVVQKAVANLIDKKKPEDAFALIKYDNRIVAEVPLTKDKNELQTKLKQNGLSEMGGCTAIIDGIDAGIAQWENANSFINRAVVIFTDGWENSSTLDKKMVMDSAANKKIQVFAVDFGANINPGYMKDIADKTNGHYYHIYSTDEFNMVFEDIYRRIRNSYVLEFMPSSFGDHDIQLKVCLSKDSAQFKTQVQNEPVKGAKIGLNVFFDTNKSNIKEESIEEVKKIADFLKKYSKIKIQLAGHTDNVGNDNTNKKLSEERAESVKKKLVELGIDAARISTIGYGKTKPITPNDSEEGRSMNRRTELMIVE